jgi:hypothetical protein
MIDWPKDLVRDIARRRCVVVVGSGVSRQAIGVNGAKPPTWHEFLSDCNSQLPNGQQEHIKDAISEGDLLNACEWLQNQYKHRWTEK